MKDFALKINKFMFGAILGYVWSGSIYGEVVGTEPISPLESPAGLSPSIVKLGRKLFFDSRLSSDNSVSCSSCHQLNHGGADDKHLSIGVQGKTGIINAPSVFNSGNNFAQFWDGRAPDLNSQIDGPTQNPVEMNSNWPEIVKKLNQDSDYRKDFEENFHSEINSKYIKEAISTFEKSLVTLNAPFDRYLRGHESAISSNQKAGYKLFKEYGCVSCHQGQNVGGNLYQKMGVMASYFEDRGHIDIADYGRFNVTKREEDKYFFKVPSLRNVALTAPYFHDGSAKTLPDAVRTMGRYQLGRIISDKDLKLIVEFLQSLTGDMPEGAKP